MPATPAQQQRIAAFNTQLLAGAANVDPSLVTGPRKLGLPPPATALGISRLRFMATRPALNQELAKQFYQLSTAVSAPEYGALYDSGGKVRDFHALTFAHINVPTPAPGGIAILAAVPKKVAKKAAPKKAAKKAGKKVAPKKASKKKPGKST